MQRLTLSLGLALALMAPALLPAQPVTTWPCTWQQDAVRTPFTSVVPVCVGSGSLGALARVVRHWGPWVLSAAALGVALGRDHAPAAPVAGPPHRPHHPDDP